MVDTDSRKDVKWRRRDVTESYFASRRGIPLADVQLDVVRRLISAHNLEIHRLLDLGAGDGVAAAAVHSWFPADRLVLVDFSHPMLDEARLRFAGDSAHVDYIAGDMLSSDWIPDVTKSGPYDLVISRFAIHHLPHERKRTLYEETFGLLRNGGLFINIEHVEPLSNVTHQCFNDLMIEGIHETSADQQSFEETTRAFHARQDRDTNILAPVEEQCAWLREIGFVDVDTAFKLFELSVFSGKRPD